MDLEAAVKKLHKSINSEEIIDEQKAHAEHIRLICVDIAEKHGEFRYVMEGVEEIESRAEEFIKKASNEKKKLTKKQALIMVKDMEGSLQKIQEEVKEFKHLMKEVL